MKGLILFLIVVALIIVSPLLTIWALNTLFPVLAIPYTWQTWVAVIIVAAIFKTTVRKD